MLRLLLFQVLCQHFVSVDEMSCDKMSYQHFVLSTKTYYQHLVLSTKCPIDDLYCRRNVLSAFVLSTKCTINIYCCRQNVLLTFCAIDNLINGIGICKAICTWKKKVLKLVKRKNLFLDLSCSARFPICEFTTKQSAEKKRKLSFERSGTIKSS